METVLKFSKFRNKTQTGTEKRNSFPVFETVCKRGWGAEEG
jgi:hypothetical protein